MRLTYVTSYDAMDVTSFSGVSHYLTRALIENGCEIDYIGNLVAPHSYFLKLKRRIYTRLGKKFEFDREPIILKNYAKQIEKKLKPNTNIIFSPGTLPVAFLKNRLPKVIYADATFAAMVNFYEEFSNLSKETIRHGNRVEKKSLENASLILYSSDWAAKSAIEDYQISPEKIRVVPFGANFDSKLTFKDVESIITKRLQSQELNLLFIGVDWKRKGGDKTILIAEALIQQGINVKLHLVGINKMPQLALPSYVIQHGFINQRNPLGLTKIKAIFQDAHFFIMPTQADCTPIVFSEANSFGVPCITNNVGGIGTIIKNGVNGQTFNPRSQVEEYVNFIKDIYSDKDKYLALALSSYNEYEVRLNWTVAGKRIVDLLKDLI